MTTRLALALGVFLCASPCRGEGVGFALQALLSGGVPLLGAPGGGTAPVGPTLRAGLSAPALTGALSLGYQGLVDPGDGRGGLHALAAGLDLLPSLWYGKGGQARLYLLLGGNVGLALRGGGEAPLDQVVSGGFSAGVGGQYFLHRNFALGVELGSRTQLWQKDDRLGASAGLYGALSGTFVAGGG